MPIEVVALLLSDETTLIFEMWEDDYASLKEVILSLDTYDEPRFTEIADVEGVSSIIDLTQVKVIGPAEFNGPENIIEGEFIDYDED